MTSTRVIIPDSSDFTNSSTVTRSTLSALRGGVNQAKTAVELAKRSVESRRTKRISTLLAKSVIGDGFTRAQVGLILGTGALSLKSIIGTLNVPVAPANMATKTKEALESGGIGSLKTGSYYTLSLSSEVSVSPVSAGEVKEVILDYAAECPINASSASSESSKIDEISNKPLCAFGLSVKVAHSNGIEVVYGGFNSLSVSKGDKLTESSILGSSGSLKIQGYKNGKPLDNFLLYLEPINPVVLPEAATNTSYEINSSKPYGPIWKKVRPPGLPENVRSASKRGVGPTVVTEAAKGFIDDPDFYTISTLIHKQVTDGGYLALPSRQFEVRCSIGEVALEGTECFRDTGPFPRGEAEGLIDGPFRNTSEEFNSNWGAFQISLNEWKKLTQAQGISILGQRHVYSQAGSTPWEASQEDEVKAVLSLFSKIWLGLGEAHLVYKALLLLLAITDLDALEHVGNSISTNPDANLSLDAKCKIAWESLDDYRATDPVSGKFIRELVEASMNTVRGSIAKKYPKVLANLADAVKPAWIAEASDSFGEPRYNWTANPPFRSTYIKIGTGRNAVKSYGIIRVGTPNQDSFRKVYDRCLELGGKWTTSGSRRLMTSKARMHSISMHNIGRAIDLSINCGLIVDPNDDIETSIYLVIADDRSQKRSKFTVWCKVFPGLGDEQKKQEALAQGIIQDRTFVVDLYSTRWPKVTGKKTVTWTGKAFNLTKIFSDNGWERIRPIVDYYRHDNYMGLEWWHYETYRGLVPGATTIGQEIRGYYTLNQASLDRSTRHPNYNGIKNKTWGSWYSR